MTDTKNRFAEVFEIEMAGWCYGIEQYPGEIFPGLVHAVIRELSPAFKAAFEYGYVFDVIQLSDQLARAAKYLVHEKEICFSILAQFPNPAMLDEDAQFTMARVLDQAETQYGGILSRLLPKWEAQNRKRATRREAA
jgi:hypothetical protein